MNGILSNVKRRYVRSGWMLFCLILLASCEKQSDVSVTDTESVMLDFSATVSSARQPQTRAGAVDGDKFSPNKDAYSIALWVCEAENTPVNFAPAKLGYDNLLAALWVSDGQDAANNMEEWDYVFDGRSHNTISVRKGTAVDIYAYYPRVTEVEFKPDAVPFVSGETDWMWANSPGYTDDGKQMHLSEEQTNAASENMPVKVPMTFHHAMTCIQVNMKCKYDGSVHLTEMRLTDSQGRLYSKGTMNAWTGELKLDEADKGETITIKPNNTLLYNDKTRSFYIMMPEVKDYQDRQFTLSFFYDNGTEGLETYSLPVEMNELDAAGQATGKKVTITAFETGKRYIYNLTLDNTMRFEPVGVDENWPTGQDHEIDLEL